MIYLSPEIVLIILEHLPPSFFQQDLRRLTLCKRWYHHAYPQFIRELEYGHKAISRLVNDISPPVTWALTRLRHETQTLTIVLAYKPTHIHAKFQTCFNLIKLGHMIGDSKTLTHVRYFTQKPAQTRSIAIPDPTGVPLNFVSSFLLSLKHLTDLELGLCGSGGRAQYDPSVHFCPTIKKLLPQLRSLSIRTPWLCKEAFQVDSAELKLQRLIVNMDLGHTSVYDSRFSSTRICGSWELHTLSSMIRELKGAARVIARGMNNSGNARIILKTPNGVVPIWDDASDGASSLHL